MISKMKPDLKKILYLDSDIAAFGDIEKLYDEDLEDKVMAAVPEYMYNDINLPDIKNKLDLSSEHKYFNAGVMLIDNQKWIEAGISDKVFEIEKLYKDRLFYADQDILNIIFDNDYKILDEKYNYTSHRTESSSDTIIRHYNTAIKPADINPELNSELIPDIDEFWKYAEMTPYYDMMIDRVKNQTFKSSDYMALKFKRTIAVKHKNEFIMKMKQKSKI